MKKRTEKDIAVIGTREQTDLMRMAGVVKFMVIEEDQDIREKVRAALIELMGDTSVAIVVIPESWRDHVEDIRQDARRRKRNAPVVVTIPSGYRTSRLDVKRFYQAFTKRLIGFNIEI